MALDLIKAMGVDVLDIHAGGVDLIFPHHEDEIAQSCAYTGKPDFARFWLHGEFLNVQGSKMSKREGNIFTARDLRDQGIDAGAVRFLLFGTHYQQKLDWNDDALAAATTGSVRLGRFRDRLVGAAQIDPGAEDPESVKVASQFRARFTDALNDNLNAPQALAAVFEVLLPEGNRLLDERRAVGPALAGAWELVDCVLDIAPAARAQTIKVEASLTPSGDLDVRIGRSPGDDAVTEDGVLTTPPEVPPPEPEGQERWARNWAEVRVMEKRRRNFAEADRIRTLLRKHGWEVQDAKDGSIQLRKLGGG
jgi:cysteinyl-tRNA synthetase